MFKPVLLAVLLTAQTPSATNHVGLIAGKLVVPTQRPISKAQVILLSPDYTERWNTDVQQRLDNYWERFRPTFIQQKELFAEVTRMAYRDSIDSIVSEMRRSDPKSFSEYVRQSTDGQFEFKNVPFGKYRLLAIGLVAGQDLIWEESVQLDSSVPRYIQLKKTVP